ncbi:PHD/YefM family antitoxin component YafN of YafNO toxin-antitoxin module [Devosia sp. UYZn731]
MRAPITLTKHGRASVVVVPADVFERMMNNDDLRRAYGAGEMPADFAKMFSAQLEQDSADYQASKDN